jgi:hypothetical protein
MKIWVTEHKTGGAGACIDFKAVMKNVNEIINYSNSYTLEDLDGNEDVGWITLGEKYSAVLVDVEGS